MTASAGIRINLPLGTAKVTRFLPCCLSSSASSCNFNRVLRQKETFS